MSLFDHLTERPISFKNEKNWGIFEYDRESFSFSKSSFDQKNLQFLYFLFMRIWSLFDVVYFRFLYKVQQQLVPFSGYIFLFINEGYKWNLAPSWKLSSWYCCFVTFAILRSHSTIQVFHFPIFFATDPYTAWFQRTD